MNSRWNYLLLKKTFSDPTCGFACSFGSTETWQYKGQQTVWLTVEQPGQMSSSLKENRK
jgi:hypothetical protein